MTETIDGRADVRLRIVDAAARLLREDGSSAVTTRGVAERAGVQAPTIYRLFGDKDGLLEAVAEHTLADYVASKSAVAQGNTAAGVDPMDDLRAGWDRQIDFSLQNPAVFRLLSEPHRALSSPAVRSGMDVLESRVRRLAISGRLRVGEQHAVNLIHAAGVGVIQALLEQPAATRDLELADTMFHAVMRQLVTAAPAEETSTGAVAAAVMLRAGTADLEMLSAAERSLLAEWLDRVITVLSAAGAPANR